MAIFFGNTSDKFLKSWFRCRPAHADSAWAFHIKLQGIAVAQLSGLGDELGDSESEAMAPFRELSFHLTLSIWLRSFLTHRSFCRRGALPPVFHKCSF